MTDLHWNFTDADVTLYCWGWVPVAYWSSRPIGTTLLFCF